MKRVLFKCAKVLFPKYEIYTFLIWKNRINHFFIKKKNHKYLFILSPPFCGSTLLNELISTSKSVSTNNHIGTREGQKLPTVKKIMFDHDKRWDNSLDYDWNYIKNEWLKYWDLRSLILLEKSPPNIIRAKSIQKNFHPSYFIIFYRNPYAHCESIIRRSNGKTDARNAALFAIFCLKIQRDNIIELKNKIVISYEELTCDTNKTVTLLNSFLPELIDIDSSQHFSAHNYLQQNLKIKNLNEDKINRLNHHQINEINKVFKDNLELLDFFKYSLMEN